MISSDHDMNISSSSLSNQYPNKICDTEELEAMFHANEKQLQAQYISARNECMIQYYQNLAIYERQRIDMRFAYQKSIIDSNYTVRDQTQQHNRTLENVTSVQSNMPSSINETVLATLNSIPANTEFSNTNSVVVYIWCK